MAVTDWNNLTSITREKVLPKIVDEITKEHPLLAKFFANAERLDGGNTVDVVVKYVNSTQGGSYAGLETLDSAQETTRTRARFNWRQMHQPIVIANMDVAKNGGESKVADLVRQEMEEAKIDLKDKFATAIYAAYGTAASGTTANSGKAIDSLVGAADDGTGCAVYGGITRSGATWFNGYYSDANTTLTLAIMRTAWASIAEGSEQPDIIATTPTIYNTYESLLTANMQYATNVSGRSNTGEGSFTGLSFRNIPLMADNYCTSGYMYMLNTKYLKFYTLKHPDYPTGKEGFAMTDLQRPDTQDGKIGYILWYGNLVCTQPRRQGRIIRLS